MLKMINDSRISVKSLLAHYRTILNSYIAFIENPTLEDKDNTHLYLGAVLESLDLRYLTRTDKDLITCLTSLRALAFVVMDSVENLPARH